MNASQKRSWRWSAAGAALLVGAQAAWADCHLSQLEIPVRIVNHRPIATLTLNGTEVPMLLDSGAFFSMLPASTATQLGLPLQNPPRGLVVRGYTGKVEDLRMTRVEKVGFRDSEIADVDFVVGGNELGSGIQGVLGRNFLSMADTEYDLAHGVVRLVFPKGECKATNLADWAGDAPVIVTALESNAREYANEVRVAVRINGVELRALMDTGAPTTSLRLASARRADIKEGDLKQSGWASGIGEGRARSWTGPMASFELGGEKIVDNVVKIDEVDYSRNDMLLGLDYFLSHRIYVSRLQKKVYATWNGGPVFARNASDRADDPRYAARPADVAPDDADALARRGEAAAARGELAKALEDLDRACELAPSSADNFLARARVHLALRQAAKARLDLDQALTLKPDLSEARVTRAALRVSAGQRDGALADLGALDAGLPPSDQMRERLAGLYARLNLAPEALRQWGLWLPAHGTDVRLAGVLNDRCWLRTRLNQDVAQALEDCKAAVDKDGGEALYLDSLGWTYLRLDDARKAVEAFDAAIKLKALPFAHYGRALAEQRLGQADAARSDLEAARRLGKDVDERVRVAGLPVAGDAPMKP
ncbi:aspartyl protease family protein [Roseateles sp. BYS78W]|uniref:Aspartyl protease family protein n=1 Tax=Pelomonas candidula TaxID=3299025 RepID=A0ABW7HKN5_9BURK